MRGVLPGQPPPGLLLLFLAILAPTLAAPASSSVDEWHENYNSSDLAFPETGCYYQYRHYDEGDQIVTNEPCLNCTCHNQMLMCFLRVCPFIKPVGKNCVVEKKDNQCCPTISCPPVPVDIWTSTALPPALAGPGAQEAALANLPMSTAPGGCHIEGEFYMDGMKIPSDPANPCDLCYCIRNHTACVMQECSLKVEGCEPVYLEGVCCPVKYLCKDGSVVPGIESEEDMEDTSKNATMIAPVQKGCTNNGQTYANGADIVTEDPCEHCYCLNGDMVCAIQECMGPLEGSTDNCQPLPPPPGQCCPAEYKCNAVETMSTQQPDLTTLPTTEEGGAAQPQEAIGGITESGMEETTTIAEKETDYESTTHSGMGDDNEATTETPEEVESGSGEVQFDDVDEEETEVTTQSDEVAETTGQPEELVETTTKDEGDESLQTADQQGEEASTQPQDESESTTQSDLEPETVTQAGDENETTIQLEEEAEATTQETEELEGTTQSGLKPSGDMEATTQSADTEDGSAEIQFDDVDDGDYEDITTTETFVETTTVSSLVSDIVDTVTTTISSIFGTPEVTESVKEDSVETEKSPPANQEPNIAIPDITGSLDATETPADEKLDSTLDSTPLTDDSQISNNIGVITEETTTEANLEDADMTTESIQETAGQEETDVSTTEDSVEATTTSNADEGTTTIENEASTTTDSLDTIEDDDIPSNSNSNSDITIDTETAQESEVTTEFADEKGTTDVNILSTVEQGFEGIETTTSVDMIATEANDETTTLSTIDTEEPTTITQENTSTEESKNETTETSDETTTPLINYDDTDDDYEYEVTSTNDESEAITEPVETEASAEAAKTETDTQTEEAEVTTEISEVITEDDVETEPTTEKEGVEATTEVDGFVATTLTDEVETTSVADLTDEETAIGEDVTTEVGSEAITTEDPIFITSPPCDPSACVPPVGYETCRPLPPTEGECCPTQYECSEATTETVTEEAQTESGETDATTDATESVIDLFNSTEDAEEDLTCMSATGAVYENFAEVPTQDPCRLCQCTEGEIVCAVEECALPEGLPAEACTPLPLAPGACCPQYECTLPQPTTENQQIDVSTQVPEDIVEATTTVGDTIGSDVIADETDLTTQSPEDSSTNVDITTESVITDDALIQDDDTDDYDATEQPTTTIQSDTPMKDEETTASIQNDDTTTEAATTTLLCLVLGTCGTEKEEKNEENGGELALPQVKPDDQVPSLNTGECFFEGTVYQDFEDVPSSNPCNLCYCSFGTVICAERECLPPTGYDFCKPLPAREGECCPEQYECSLGETETTTVTIPTGPVGPDGLTTTLPEDELASTPAPGPQTEEPGPPSPPAACQQGNEVYDHLAPVPALERCQSSCSCISGQIVCDRLPCHPAPEGMNCTETFIEGECCPIIECVGDSLPKPDSDSHIIEETTPTSETEVQTSEIFTNDQVPDSVTENNNEEAPATESEEKDEQTTENPSTNPVATVQFEDDFTTDSGDNTATEETSTAANETDATTDDTDLGEETTTEPASEAPITNEDVSTDAPVTDETSTELTSTDAPDTDEVEEASTDTTDTEDIASEVVSTDAPSTDALSTALPGTDEIATEDASTDAPTTDSPTTDSPATDAPATDATDATDAPATELPATDAPSTDGFATDAPSTDGFATDDPATDAPATDAPEEEASTGAPTTTEGVAAEEDNTNTPATDATNELATEETNDGTVTIEPVTDAVITEVTSTDESATNAPLTDAESTDATTQAEEKEEATTQAGEEIEAITEAIQTVEEAVATTQASEEDEITTKPEEEAVPSTDAGIDDVTTAQEEEEIEATTQVDEQTEDTTQSMIEAEVSTDAEATTQAGNNVEEEAEGTPQPEKETDATTEAETEVTTQQEETADIAAQAGAGATTDEPSTDSPATDAPSAFASTTSALGQTTSEILITNAPTNAPDTEVIDTEAPATQSPVTEVVTTEVSSTEAVTTEGADEITTKKPSMKICLHKGMIIQNLADVPSKDPCQLCQCVEGAIVCASQECRGPPSASCRALPRPSGVCCPEYDCSPQEDTTLSSIEEDLVKTTISGEIQFDDVDDDGEDEVVLDLESLTTTLKPFVPTFSSPKPVTSTQLTTLLTTTLAAEGVATTVTDAAIQEYDDGTFGTASGDVFNGTDDGYVDFDLESIGPGACLFENKIYVSAQQIPRDNPCDFCFCFRGDIICLQQSCPPPIPGCTEEIIGGFCCPRYECPVKMSIHNVTHHRPATATEPPSLASWFGWGAEAEGGEGSAEEEEFTAEVKGCEVQGEFYEAGAIVTASSGPCLQCRCDYNEKLDCEPQDCETQPLIKRMMENFR